MSDEISPENRNYEVFIRGETIDLVIPSKQAIDLDNWHSWFNDPQVTEYSDYGLYPNTIEAQHEYLEKNMKENNRRLILLIRPIGMDHVVGVASLSNIHPIHRSAETAIVVADRRDTQGVLFWGLEAKALLTEHSFETLGLERVGGAQAMPLADWQRIQTLFGYRPEGIKRNAHRRGYHVYDSVLSSCTLDDYLKTKAARNGKYWPGRTKLLELIRQLPKRSIAQLVDEAINDAVTSYLKDVTLD